MMNPDPQTGGLFSFLNRMRRPNQTTGLNPIQNFAQALDPLILPSMRGGEAIRAQGQQRVAEDTKNKTILELEKMAANNPMAAQLLAAVRSGAMTPADAYKQLITTQYDTSGSIIRATERFPNGAYYVVTDAGRKVYNPQGQLVTGEEAAKVLLEAQESQNLLQAQGVGLSEAQKMQAKYVNEAFEKSEQLTGSIANIDTAIGAIDAGAERNIILNALPDVTEQSATLTSALRRMGLDVVSSVTFGALSQSELNIAMATAYPPNATTEELREFLVKRKSALQKLRKYTEEAAMFLQNTNNTRADWMQIVQQRRNQAEASIGGNPYLDMDLAALNEAFNNRASLNEAQRAQLIEALRQRR
tara:strand:+ start:728 stop:1804 length:1077 start_codon:yes stop_codon:yes gene_type:complete